MAELQLKIDPTGAVQGARVVQRSLNDMANAAESAETAIEGVSGAATGMTQVANDSRRVSRSIQDINNAARQAEQGINRARDAMGRLVQTGNGAASGIRAANDELQRQRSILETINRATGVSGRQGGFGRADDIREYGKELDRLRAKFSPLSRISQDYQRALGEIRDAHRVGAISAKEMENAIAEAGLVANAQQRVYAKWREGLEDVAEGGRLTGNQLRNLSYQANDAITMFMSGSSVFQIFATQAGQVFQVLQEGGGVTQNLKALGSAFLGLLTPMNLAIAGFTALAAGAVYFATRGEKGVVPLTDAMESHQKAVERVAGAYGIASGEAEKFQRAPAGLAAFNVRQSRAQLELSARASLNDNFKPGLVKDLFGSPVYQQGLGDSGRVITEVAKEFAAFEKPVLALVEGLEKGTARADLFVDAVAEIANLQPANKELQEAAKKLIDLAGAAAEAQRQMAGLGPAFAKAARDAKLFNDLAGDLGQFIPNRQTDAQRIEQTFQQMMRLAKTEADITRAQDLRRLSLEGLSEVEARRRAGYDLDVRAVTAKSAAERAQIEYERTYADVLASTNDAAQAARQGQEARDLSLKQSQHDLTEAMNERIRSGQQQVEQLQQEIDTFGKSAGEVARLRTETELLTAARNAARQAGEIVDPAEEAKIREQAAAIGELTDRMARLNLGRDQEERMRQLQAEAGLIGMNDDARRVALAGLEAEVELRRQGIPLNDAWGASYVANARQIATMDVALDKQREAFESVRDVAKDFFETLSSGGSVMDALAGAFGKLGQQLASKGFDKLFGQLLGNGGQSSNSLANTAGTIAQALTRPSSGGAVVDQTYAAPLGTVTRAPLGPIEVSLPQSSSRSVERAGNAFLDLIRKAEGTAGPNGYNTSLAYGRFTGGERNLTGMTLGQIDQLQTAMLRHPDNSYNSSALGAYQIVQRTLRGLRDELKLSASDLFSPELQDKLAMTLAQRRGASVSGLRNEWEGFRRVDGGTILSAYNARGESASTTTRAYERATERGVEKGMTNVLPSIDGGYAGYGRTGAIPTPTANPGQSGGGGLLSNLFGGQGGGMIGAGLGSFFSGYQSGSPISGALGGLMAGASFGPAGMVVGALAGALGGGIGGRAQRKQAHQQAAAEWAANQPAYEAFKRSLTGKTGTMRGQFSGEWSQFQQYVASGSKAWKMGSGNSTAEFDSTGLLIMNRAIKAMSEFRESFDQLLVDVAKGLGSNSPFTKGTEAVKTMRANYLSALDDVEVAFGKADNGLPLTGELLAWEKQLEDERNAAVAAFKKASIDNALGLLDIVEPMSDVAQALDGYRGIAERMTPVLIEMGMAAEEAAKAVSERFNGVLAKLRDTFEQGVSDRLLDLQGKGYLVDAREMLKEFTQLQADAALLGADQSNFPELFKLQAQSIVDGAELTGDAFAELVRLFPQLNGVVSEFVEKAAEAAKRTAEELDKLRLSYSDRAFEAGLDTSTEAGALSRFDRYANRERETEAKAGGEAMADLERALAAERLAIVKDFREREIEEAKRVAEEAKRIRDEAVDYLAGFAKDIGSYLDGLRAGPSSPLNARDRLSEAETQFAKQYALAKSGDRDALSEITSYSDRLLEASRGYDASSPAYQAVFDRVTKALEDLPKLVRPEDLIKKAIDDASKLTVEALEVMRIALGSAIQSGPKATADALSSYFTLLDSSLDGLLSFDELRAGLNGIATDAQIRQMMNVLDANGDGQISKLELLNSTASGQGAALNDIQRLTRLTWEQATWEQGIFERMRGSLERQEASIWTSVQLLERIRANLAAANGKTGAPQYMQGGYTGNLPTTAAAGVVHGQEFVAHAEATRRWRPMLEQMNAGTFRMPTIAMPAMPSFVNDNRELVIEIRSLRQEVSRLREENNAVTERAGERVREGVDDLKGAADQGNRETRRARRAG